MKVSIIIRIGNDGNLKRIVCWLNNCKTDAIYRYRTFIKEPLKDLKRSHRASQSKVRWLGLSHAKKRFVAAASGVSAKLKE